MIRVADDLMAPFTLDMCDEADAAAFMLEFRAVQPVSGRQA
jgi:hypothetical protein